MKMTRAEAALDRREQVRALADRPSQRRALPETGSPAIVRAELTDFDLRAGSKAGTLEFTGYATVTEQPYEMYDLFGPYSEVIDVGAPAKALSSNPDVNFVLNHGGVPFARTKSGTLQLSADDTGLKVDATLDQRMPSAQDVVVALERGDLDEMSFKFRILNGEWSPDYESFRIHEFDLDRGDVSVVNYGANPYTSASLRSKTVDLSKVADDALRAEVARRAPKTSMSRARLDVIAAG